MDGFTAVTTVLLAAFIIALVIASFTLAIYRLRERAGNRRKALNHEGFRITKIIVYSRDWVHFGSYYSGIRIRLVATKGGHVATLNIQSLAGEFYPSGDGCFRLNTQSLKSMDSLLNGAYNGLFRLIVASPQDLVQDAIARAIVKILPSPYIYLVPEGTKGAE